MSQSRSKFPLVILDTGIVIECFRNGSWKALISSYQLIVSRTVVDESIYYWNDRDEKVPIDLKPFEVSGQIVVIEVEVAKAADFRRRFDPSYFERLDPGELESLTYLLDGAVSGIRICSADGIVYRVLGRLKKSELGISLEELLNAIGVKRKLDEKYTRRIKERWAQQGLADSL